MMEHEGLGHSACAHQSFCFIRSRKQFWKPWFAISWQTLTITANGQGGEASLILEMANGGEEGKQECAQHPISYCSLLNCF